MSTPRRGCALALLVLIPAMLLHAEPAQPPSSFTAQYTVSRNGLGVGEARVSLEIDADGRYVYETRTSSAGVLAWLRKAEVSERSSWVLHGNEIRPLQYEYRQLAGKRERHVRLVFDWEHNTVRNHVGGDSWTMPVPDGTVDKLVVQLALMMDLQDGTSALEYHVADGGTLKTYQFDVIGTETVQTPLGSFETTRVERRRPSEQERSTVVWYAPELDYLPVQIEQREKNGAHFRMSLERLEKG